MKDKNGERERQIKRMETYSRKGIFFCIRTHRTATQLSYKIKNCWYSKIIMFPRC